MVHGNPLSPADQLLRGARTAPTADLSYAGNGGVCAEKSAVRMLQRPTPFRPKVGSWSNAGGKGMNQDSAEGERYPVDEEDRCFCKRGEVRPKVELSLLLPLTFAARCPRGFAALGGAAVLQLVALLVACECGVQIFAPCWSASHSVPPLARSTRVGASINWKPLPLSAHLFQQRT